VVWYHLKDEPKDEVKLEVLNSAGKVIATATKKPKKLGADTTRDGPDTSRDREGADDDADDDDGDDKQEKKPRKLPTEKGLNQFVWDLTHDGADTIGGAKVDAGNPGMGVPVAAGKFKVRLTVGKQTQEQAVEVLPDGRVKAAAADAARVRSLQQPFLSPHAFVGPFTEDKVLDGNAATVERVVRETLKKLDDGTAQEKFALEVRDHIQTLADTVNRLRSLRKQIDARKELFKENDAAKAQVEAEAAFEKKLAALEERMHNPKAKVVYDVFAAKPGAMLYSQFTYLLGNVIDGDGVPTKAQTETAVGLVKTLAEYSAEWDKLTADGLKGVNESAKKAGLPELYLPPAKKK
jgi:hypothetical protein